MSYSNEVGLKQQTMSHSNLLGIRQRTLASITLLSAIFLATLIGGSFITKTALEVDLLSKFQSPSLQHLFGTDWMGRDMLYRTLKGLSLSIKVGILCSLASGLISLVLGVLGPDIGGKADALVSWLIDLVLSVPHTITILLISFACGGGFTGVVVGVTLTHWPSLTRVIRGEVMQINEAEYTKIAKKLGKSNLEIARTHILPHVLPQLLVGIVLVFPHAILHEASITFLGFGLPPHEPAIGVILSEAMKYLTSGKWWLAFFPGVALVMVSMVVDKVGKNIEKLMNPTSAYK